MCATLDHGVHLLPRRRAWVHSAFLWVMLFVWMQGACDRPTDQGAEGDLYLKSMKAQSKPKVALIMKSLANEFFSTMADGARMHESSHPGQYELITNGIKDERDLTRQAALVDEMIAAGVDAIVIAPADSKALVPALRRAKKAGIVVVNIDNKLDDDVLASAGITIPFVGPNNFKGAKSAGEFLAKRLQHGDHVAILEGIRTSLNGTERRLGFEEAMKDARVTVVDSQSAQWETNLANTITASIINEHPELKGILAANDSMALGAIAAIKAANKGDQIQVVGFDNISAVKEAIRDGKILATVDQHGDKLAVFGIEAALQILSDPSNTVSDRETPVDLITAEDLIEKP